MNPINGHKARRPPQIRLRHPLKIGADPIQLTMRAGKPQFFFAAQTSLTAAELTVRRRKAIADQQALGRPEVLDEVLVEITPEALALCTLECQANLALVG